MTEDECLLAFGKPQTISESNGEVQWMSPALLSFFQKRVRGNDYKIRKEVIPNRFASIIFLSIGYCVCLW